VTEPRSDAGSSGRRDVAPPALVVDYGGVLTTPLDQAMRAWCEADGIDHAHFLDLMATWLRGSAATENAPPNAAANPGPGRAGNPAHRLERGELTGPEFERLLAAELRTAEGRPASAEGMLARMFAGFQVEPAMVDVVRRARAAGHPTALLSNSWGLDYDRTGWGELFDVTVISGEVGLRKPEPEIYLLTADRLGVRPGECVFVDDLGPNVRAAEQVGMVGIRHVTAEQTIAELASHLRVDAAAA
jgi:epoxide hydrolase-like predicted phosphatase